MKVKLVLEKSTLVAISWYALIMGIILATINLFKFGSCGGLLQWGMMVGGVIGLFVSRKMKK